jgi:hypothetical protein
VLARALLDGDPCVERSSSAGGQEFSFGSASVASAGTPRLGDPDAGIEVPRVDLNGAFRFKIGQDVDLGFVWDQGLDEGAVSLAPDQPSTNNGDVYGGGLSLGYSAAFPDEPRFRMGLTVDLLFYSVPFVEYRTCIENCQGQPMLTTMDRGRAGIPVVAIGAVPSFRLDRLTLYGGFTLRNHPTVERGEIEEDLDLDDGDEEVSGGSFNVVASVGLDVEVTSSLRASLQIYQPLTETPVRYLPTIALGIALPIGAPPNGASFASRR